MGSAIWQIHDVQVQIIDNPGIPETNNVDDIARQTGIQAEEITNMLPFADKPQKLYRLKTVKKFKSAYGEEVTNCIARVPQF